MRHCQRLDVTTNGDIAMRASPLCPRTATKRPPGGLTAWGPLLILAASASGAYAAPASPLGVWIDHNGRGAVEIKPCGAALCGKVVWVKNTADTKGCGRQIIGDAVASGSRAHVGWIYSPEDKKRYNVEITPQGSDRLRVVGYAGIKLFSRTMYWTRAADDLTRCGTEQAKEAPRSVNTAAKAEEKAEDRTAATPSVPPPRPARTAAASPATEPSSAPKVDAETAKRREEVTPAKAPVTARPAEPMAAAEPEPAAAAEPEPTPQAGADETADAPPDDAGTAGEEASAPRAGLDLGNIDLDKLDLKSLDLDKVLQRTAGGKCKLDLPWVKVRFSCD